MDNRVVYQCPICATSMEVDPSAKPFMPAMHNLAQEDFDNMVRDAMRWRAEDCRMFKAAFDALQRLNAGRSAWNGPIHQAAAILRDATGPQPPDKPQVVVDEKVFDMAHGLRPLEEGSSDESDSDKAARLVRERYGINIG